MLFEKAALTFGEGVMNIRKPLIIIFTTHGFEQHVDYATATDTQSEGEVIFVIAVVPNATRDPCGHDFTCIESNIGF